MSGEISFIPVTDADEVFSFAVRAADTDNSKQAKPKRLQKPKKEPVLPVTDGGVPLSGGVRC